MDSFRDLFLLDPEIISLNHGSFGACPLPVFEVYQTWQRELERQPVEFLGRRITDLLAQSRARLAVYLGVDPDEVVFFTNPTTAINMIARSLAARNHALLKPGDEILATNHEYGAMDRTWRFICRQTGWRYIQQPIALPVNGQAEFVEDFWSSVSERTRVIFISHISSPTALIFPVQEICRRAREAGIISIIDGAHAPGQIALNLHQIGADFYTGACHKWLMAPKGAGFLYARRELQSFLDPLVVSWGYESIHPSSSQFVDYHEWQGTRDFSAFLSVPAAIDFQDAHDWPTVRQGCHTLATWTRKKINGVTGLDPICPEVASLESSDHLQPWFMQMFTARLPSSTDLDELKNLLYTVYRIEVPTIDWNGEKYLRVSIQCYNSQEDAEALVKALRDLLEN